MRARTTRVALAAAVVAVASAGVPAAVFVDRANVDRAPQPAAAAAAPQATAADAAPGTAAPRVAAPGGSPGAAGSGLGPSAGRSATSGSSAAVTTGLVAAPLASRIRLGADVLDTDWADPALVATVKANFSTVNLNDAFLWTTAEPSRGEVDLASAESQVALAKAAGLTVHAGHLVWDHAGRDASYVAGDSPAELRADLASHIQALMTPFATGALAGTVSSWNVVNEPFTYSLTAPALNRGPFEAGLGDSYIVDAFDDAYAVDKTTDLCLNEVNAEVAGPRANALYAEVVSLLKRGAPISCIGFETHEAATNPTDAAKSEAAIQANIARFAALRNEQGRQLHVEFTEADVAIPDDGLTPVDPAQMEQQSLIFGRIAQACAAVAQCDEITAWGVSDGESWAGSFYTGCGPAPLPSDLGLADPTCGAALLFDEALHAKVAAAAVARALGLDDDELLTRTGAQLSPPAGATVVGKTLAVTAPGTASTVFGVAAPGTFDLAVGAEGAGSPDVSLSVDGRTICTRAVGTVVSALACPVALAAGSHTARVTTDATTARPLTIDALSLARRDPLTAPSSADGGSRGGRGWTFSGDGTLSVPVVAEQDSTGQLLLDVGAVGAGTGGTGVTVAVLVDGVLASTTVASAPVATLSVPVAMTAGAHLVTVVVTAGTPGPAVTVGGLSYAATAVVDSTDVGSATYTDATGLL